MRVHDYYAAHVLHYTRMYEARPYPDAVIAYRREGTYSIWSEGERHHGLYVADGPLDTVGVRVRYIAAPSPDWDGTAVLHDLVFDDTAFTQHLHLPLHHHPTAQFGHHTLITDRARLTGLPGATWAEVTAALTPR